MENQLLGKPVSKGNLKKITIYSDRLEAKEFLTPMKVFPLNEIISWSEVRVIQNPGNIHYLRLKIYTEKKQYTILSLHWQNYTELRDVLIEGKSHIDEASEKNGRTIIIALSFIVLTLGICFLIDYFQTQSLLKNGIRVKAEVTAKFYEINRDNNDTTSYSFRLSVLPDTTNDKTIYKIPDRLQAYVKQKAFYKYIEGSIVNVVYDKEDLDHAKLVEEIE